MHKGGDVPSAKDLKALSAAYSRMGYDFGLLTQHEKEVFTTNNLESPQVWQAFLDRPYAQLRLSNSESVGVVVFPPLKEGTEVADEKTLRKIKMAIQEARKQNSLVVALSEWGHYAEKDYLARSLPVMPDILLGSGRGPGLDGSYFADGRTLYVRPYNKGRTVCEIEVIKWPEPRGGHVWQPNNDVRTRVVPLDNKYYDDPKIQQIVQDIEGN